MELEPIVQKIGTQYDPVGLMGFIGDLGIAGIAATAAAASIALVTGAVVEAVKSTIAWGDSLNDVSMKLGTTTEQSAGYKLVADAAGLSVDDLTRGLDIMAKNLMTVSGTLGTSGKALDSLHISFRDADGTLRNSTDIFQDVANKLGTMADGTTKTALEMEIFGRSGTSMNEVLKLAAGDGMQKYIDQAKQMGLALSASQVEGIKNLSVNMNVLKDQFQGIAVIIGSAFIPAVSNIVDWIGRMVGAITPAIQQFGEFLGQLLGVTGTAPAAASAVAGAGQLAAGYSRVGVRGNTIGGAASDIMYTNPLTGGLTSTPQYVGGSAASAGIPAGTSVFQGHGGPETEIPDWLKSFETTLTTFKTEFLKVDWVAVGADFVAAGVAFKTIADFVGSLFHKNITYGQSGNTPGPSVDEMSGALGVTNVLGRTEFGDMMDKYVTKPFQVWGDNLWNNITAPAIANNNKVIADNTDQINHVKQTLSDLKTAIEKLPGQIQGLVLKVAK